MSLRYLLPLLTACLLPAAAGALGAPLEAPPVPDVPLGPVVVDAPPQAPPVAAPPVTLTLPGPPELPAAVTAGGPPDPLPSPQQPVGLPDLVGEVVLPPSADRVYDLAPPFGGSPGQAKAGPFAPVPEPGTAALLALGIGALALTRRR